MSASKLRRVVREEIAGHDRRHSLAVGTGSVHLVGKDFEGAPIPAESDGDGGGGPFGVGGLVGDDSGPDVVDLLSDSHQSSPTVAAAVLVTPDAVPPIVGAGGDTPTSTRPGPVTPIAGAGATSGGVL